MTITQLLAETRSRAGNLGVDTANDRMLRPFLMAGVEALNRRLGYFYVDDPTVIQFTAGQTEYILPQNLVRVVWLLWNGALLQKTSYDEMRKLNVNWRQQGQPLRYAVYGLRLILQPTPDQNTLDTAGANATLRYVATPPDLSDPQCGVTTLEQLCEQDQRVVVYYAAADWLSSCGETDADFRRADYLMKLFERETELIKQYYVQREMPA